MGKENNRITQVAELFAKILEKIYVFLIGHLERLFSLGVSIFFGTIALKFKEQLFSLTILSELPLKGFLLEIIIFLITTFISFIITTMSLNILITIPKYYKLIKDIDKKYSINNESNDKLKSEQENIKVEINSMKGILNEKLNIIELFTNQKTELINDNLNKVVENVKKQLKKIDLFDNHIISPFFQN